MLMKETLSRHLFLVGRKERRAGGGFALDSVREFDPSFLESTPILLTSKMRN